MPDRCHAVRPARDGKHELASGCRNVWRLRADFVSVGTAVERVLVVEQFADHPPGGLGHENARQRTRFLDTSDG